MSYNFVCLQDSCHNESVLPEELEYLKPQSNGRGQPLNECVTYLRVATSSRNSASVHTLIQHVLDLFVFW